MECLKQDVTQEEIVEKMLAKYDASEEQVRRDVEKIVEQFRQIGAIEE